MKIVQINATCGVGSTGKICISVSELLSQKGIENYVLYTLGESSYSKGIKYSSSRYVKWQALKSRILGNFGFNSYYATKELINNLKRIEPTIVHLHNIHSHNCNLKQLFLFLKEREIKVIWTFHDCWAFTAYCPYFDMIKCDLWKEKCTACPKYKSYSWFVDQSENLFEAKKNLLSNLDLTIITPSRWLANLVKQSFLKSYPVKIINNGIDLSLFKPVKTDFRERYNLARKKIVLGLSFDWDDRKGLDVFVELARRLPFEYQVVLVGINECVDRHLPENIITIHRTQNQKELAEIYTAADVFVNPTREENYPTVNMEAIACGTPVVTFRTGGSPEIPDETCGSVVDCDDIDAMEIEIRRICEEHPYSKEACLKRASKFDMNARFEEYVELYKEMTK